jgi:hypothetical protein
MVVTVPSKLLQMIFFIREGTVRDFPLAMCFWKVNFSRFLLGMSTTNVAWLLLERISQIVVYGRLILLKLT